MEENSQHAISGWNKALVDFLSVALILTLVPVFFLVPAELILYQPESYQRALRHQQFSAEFPRLLAKTIQGGGATVLSVPGLDPRGAAYLTQDTLTEAFAQIFPPTWVEVQSDNLIEGASSYLNFQTDQLSLPLNFTQVKSGLSGTPGDAAARAMVESWPPCSVDDLSQFAAQMLSGQLQGLPVCRPPAVLMPTVIDMARAAIHGMGGLLPDKIDLAKPVMEGSSPLTASLATFYRWYTLLRWFFRLLPIFSLAFLIWIALLTVRLPAEMLRGISRPMITAGFAGAVIGVILLLGLPAGAGLLARSLPGLPEPFQPVLADTLSEVGMRFVLWGGYLSAAALLVGIAMRVFALGIINSQKSV